MRLAFALCLGMMTVVPLGAQVPVTETRRVVLDTRLGGDSSQATMVDLRAGATYWLAVRPASAQLTMRRAAPAAPRAEPLRMVALHNADSADARAWEVVADSGGRHLLELTNPRIGMARVRLIMVRRGAADTLPVSLRHTLVFSDVVGGGPSYVTLDSGKIYRVIVHDDVVFTPRQQFRAQPMVVGYTIDGATGVPIMPVFTGEYRLDTVSPTASSSVQIYEEEGDALAQRCFESHGADGCVRRSGGVASALALAAIIPAIVVLDMVARAVHH
jgi:hypothetical protein